MTRKILIVDDDQKTRLLLKTYLEKNQYEVKLSHNGESFLNEFSSQVDQLSLVILDVMLPDTDGFALCKIVRQRSNVPIIMLTQLTLEREMNAAIAEIEALATVSGKINRIRLETLG